MSEIKELKFEKEGKKIKLSTSVKGKKLRSLVLKHFPKAKKLHVITEQNDFFHWKYLIQEYSSKKGMCEFLENDKLLSSNLRLQLKGCISNELELEISKLKKYLVSTKIMIQENKELPEHIKNDLLKSSLNVLEIKINNLLPFLHEENKGIITNSYLKQVIFDRFMFQYFDDFLDSRDKFDFEWQRGTVEYLIQKFINSINETGKINRDILNNILSFFTKVIHINITNDDIDYIINQITSKLKKDNIFDVNDIKYIIFFNIRNSILYYYGGDYGYDIKQALTIWNKFISDNSIHNFIKHFPNNSITLENFISQALYKESRIPQKPLVNKIMEQIKDKMKEYNSSSKQPICNFLKVNNDKYLQRRCIECIESTLAKNIYKLSFSNKIKIVQELETVVPKIQLEPQTVNYWFKLENKQIKPFDYLKPLYFQIYDVMISREKKDSKIITILDHMTGVLNNIYREVLGKHNSEPIIKQIKLISTLKYLRPFMIETEWLFTKMIELENLKSFQSDLNYLKSILIDFILIKGRYEFPIETNNLEEYIVYLIENLNLYEELLRLELPEEKKLDYDEEKIDEEKKVAIWELINDELDDMKNTPLLYRPTMTVYTLTPKERLILYDRVRVSSPINIKKSEFDKIFKFLLGEIKLSDIKPIKETKEFKLFYDHLMLYIVDKFPNLKTDFLFKQEFINILRNIQSQMTPPPIEDLQEYQDVKAVISELDRIHLREIVFRLNKSEYEKMKQLDKNDMIKFIMNLYNTTLEKVVSDIIIEIEQGKNVELKHNRYKQFLDSLTLKELLNEIKLNNQEKEWEEWKKDLHITEKNKENGIKTFLLNW